VTHEVENVENTQARAIAVVVRIPI
jgi:hypothetical protein